MVIYSHKDVKVLVDNAQICCDSISVDYKTNPAPAYTIKSPSSFDTVAASAPEGDVSLDYYYTGQDPLMTQMYDQKKYVQLNIAGLEIKSGHLMNYSVDFQNHSSIKVNARLKFYGEITGNFDPSSAQSTIYPEDIDMITSSSATFEGGKYVSQENILSLKYNYSTSIQPVRKIGQRLPDDVAHGQKKIECSLDLYEYDMSLPVTGLEENFKINLNNKNGVELSSLVVAGRVLQKSSKFSVGDNVISSYNIGSARMGLLEGSEPSVTSFATQGGLSSKGAPSTVSEDPSHSIVNIAGNNFVNVEKVLIGEFPCNVRSVSSTAISFDISSDIISGYHAPITVITQGGQTTSTQGYNVTGGLNDLQITY